MAGYNSGEIRRRIVELEKQISDMRGGGIVNDTGILNWVERHVLEVSFVETGTRIVWTKNGAVKAVTADNLREAVRKANGQTAVSQP